MRVIIEEKTIIKFFKWVILTRTVIKENKILYSEPVFVPDIEYYKREFLN